MSEITNISKAIANRFIHTGNLLSYFLTAICLASCNGLSGRGYHENIVVRIIIMPDEMKIVGSDSTYANSKSMKIIAYVDSSGCTSCNMKLQEWGYFMKRLESSVSTKEVDLCIISNSTNEHKLEALRRRSGFGYRILIDKSNSFVKRNIMEECDGNPVFLLDSINSVVIAGHPLNDSNIMSAYLRFFNSNIQ